MSSPIASLFVEIGAETNSVQKGLQQTENMLTGAASKLGAVALGVGVAGVTALAVGMWKSVEAASEAQQVQAQLNAVLKSTNGVAGVTADMANNLASGLQNVTRFEDDAILSGENMLLTFTNIGKDVFPQATETMLDMSQALGQDLKSSALQLGKALQDPIEGVSALRRVGVNFTDAQQEQIKTLVESGNLLDAQRLILKELQTEFGGAAKAAGDTFAGKLDILKNKFGDILETIGGALIPILTQGAQALIDFMANPQVQAGVANLVNGVQSIAQGIGNFFASLQSGGGGDLFGGVFGALQSAGQGLIDWVTGSLAPALTESFAQIAAAAGPTLQQMGEWINANLIPALQQLAAFLGPILGEGFRQIGLFITTQVIPALTALAVWVLGTGLPALGDFAQLVGKTLAQAFRDAQTVWAALVKGFNDANRFIEDVKENLLAVADLLMTTVANAFTWFKSNILDPIQAALAALAAYIAKVISALQTLGGMAGGAGFGNPFGGGIEGKAAGGSVSGGTPYLVGERGAELFVPRGNGTIVPNGALGGATIYITYAPTVSLMDESEARDKLAPFIRAALAGM